ncbi:hypothetical protein DSO57_1000537 [Entomophthora muscae]|uniref:Uncharacterized protein n=1 Tax=Entomophthora muscae TaxID=34485 RepID=A0ACC2RP86_9FUNG|nr:hypothetical protein DSO57_1000537 [Entomophthora muscae]
MNKLTKTIEEHISPFIVQVHELSTQISGVCDTAAVQQIQIDDVIQVSIASRDSRAQQATTLKNLEESVCQLWTMQPPVESETEFIPKAHVLNSNSQDSSNESANTGVDPNYKVSFKQVFEPKTLTIAAFLTIYEISMCQASDKLKKEHILTCLYPTCQ